MAFNVNELLRLFGNETHYSEVGGTQRSYTSAGHLVFDTDGTSIRLESDETNSKSALYLHSDSWAIGNGFSGVGANAWVNNGLISYDAVGTPANPNWTALNISGTPVLWTYDNSSIQTEYVGASNRFPLFLSTRLVDGTSLVGLSNVVVAGMYEAIPDQSNTLFTQEVRHRSELNNGIGTGDYKFFSDQSSNVTGHINYWQEEWAQSTGFVSGQAVGNNFIVIGNFAGWYKPGVKFTIDATFAYNGTYTVISAVNVGAETQITVAENIAVNWSGSGTVTIPSYQNDYWLTTKYKPGQGDNETGGNIFMDDYSVYHWTANDDWTIGGDMGVYWNPEVESSNAVLSVFGLDANSVAFNGAHNIDVNNTFSNRNGTNTRGLFSSLFAQGTNQSTLTRNSFDSLGSTLQMNVLMTDTDRSGFQRTENGGTLLEQDFSFFGTDSSWGERTSRFFHSTAKVGVFSNLLENQLLIQDDYMELLYGSNSITGTLSKIEFTDAGIMLFSHSDLKVQNSNVAHGILEYYTDPSLNTSWNLRSIPDRNYVDVGLAAVNLDISKIRIDHTITADKIIDENQMYNIFGDFTLEAGQTLDNDGRIVIVNGDFVNLGNYQQGTNGSMEVVNTNLDYILGWGDQTRGKHIRWTTPANLWSAGDSITAIDTEPGNVYVTKEWSDSKIGTYLPLAGGTMSGDITMTDGIKMKSSDGTSGIHYELYELDYRIVLNSPGAGVNVQGYALELGVKNTSSTIFQVNTGVNINKLNIFAPFSGFSSNHTVFWPDGSGTIALTSDITTPTIQQVLNTQHSAYAMRDYANYAMNILYQDNSVEGTGTEIFMNWEDCFIGAHTTNGQNAKGQTLAKLGVATGGVDVSTYNFGGTLLKQFRVGGSMSFRDDENLKGPENFTDYSANWTDHSLVTKKYVDDNVGGAVLTASLSLSAAQILAFTAAVVYEIIPAPAAGKYISPKKLIHIVYFNGVEIGSYSNNLNIKFGISNSNTVVFGVDPNLPFLAGASGRKVVSMAATFNMLESVALNVGAYGSLQDAGGSNTTMKFIVEYEILDVVI